MIEIRTASGTPITPIINLNRNQGLRILVMVLGMVILIQNHHQKLLQMMALLYHHGDRMVLIICLKMQICEKTLI